MKELDIKAIQKVVQDFEEAYFQYCRRNANEARDSFTFSNFIDQQQYKNFRETLRSQLNGFSLEDFVFDHLSDEQKNRIGGLLRYRTSLGNLLVEKQSIIIDNIIRNTDEFKGYIEVKDFLEDRERLAERISLLLYDKLSDKEKKIIDKNTVKKYLLNIGFIKMKRLSHAKAIDFITHYPALFRDEKEVLSGILERYVDDELSKTPVKETKKRIKSLREEIKKIYGSLE